MIVKIYYIKICIHTTINSNIRLKLQLNKTLENSLKFIKIIKIFVKKVNFIN